MGHSLHYMYSHVVFSTKYRAPVLTGPVRQTAYACLRKSLRDSGCHLMAMNGLADHVHVLIRFHPDCRLSQIIGQAKGSSSRFVNVAIRPTPPFRWSAGYYARSVGEVELERVLTYIRNQELMEKRKLEAWLERQFGPAPE